jgi:hypothetical protein
MKSFAAFALLRAALLLATLTLSSSCVQLDGSNSAEVTKISVIEAAEKKPIEDPGVTDKQDASGEATKLPETAPITWIEYSVGRCCFVSAPSYFQRRPGGPIDGEAAISLRSGELEIGIGLDRGPEDAAGPLNGMFGNRPMRRDLNFRYVDQTLYHNRLMIRIDTMLPEPRRLGVEVTCFEPDCELAEAVFSRIRILD